jgi:hypothetical protein
MKQKLATRFEMVDMGELQYCLGIQVIRDRQKGTLKLSQEKYVTDTLSKFRMQDSKCVSTPWVKGSTTLPPSNNEIDQSKYRSVVGRLQYLASITRPDIASVAAYCARFQEKPMTDHLVIIKRILRYLKGTKNYGIQFTASGNRKLDLIGYSDSDWDGDRVDRRSTSGYLFMLCGGVISWRSAKQKSVALSSTESEYMALRYAVQEVVWLRRFLSELGFKPGGATTIHEDNQGCIAFAKNPIDHGRLKHVDICYHFTREKIEDSTINVIYCDTKNMLADILTKPLDAPIFQYLRSKLGLAPTTDVLSGSVENSNPSMLKAV